MATERLALLITANGSQAISELQRTGSVATGSLGKAESSTKRFGQNVAAAGAKVAAFGAVAFYGLQQAAQAAAEEDLAVSKLNNTISNSPELAGASTHAFLEQAAALQDTTKFADDATIGLQALLGQFGLTQSQILELTPLVLDLSAKMGISLESAAKAVGRATQGTAGGLSRMIGEFDVGATEAEHFTATVAALTTKVGGFAEQEGEQFAGQIEIMKNNLGDLVEIVGGEVIPQFSGFFSMVTDGAEFVQGLGDAASDLGDKLGPLPELLGTFLKHLNPVGLGQTIFDSIKAQVSGGDLFGDVFSESIIKNADLVTALGNTQVAIAAAEAGMGDLADATDEAGSASERLSREWNGLSNRLGDFSATLDAQDSLFQFQDALREARQEGGISRREMVGLNQNLVDLIESYQGAAEAANTNARGTTRARQRNAELRSTLGALASFIPAELRPQFRALTRDVINVPDRSHTEVTSNVWEAIAAFNDLIARIQAASREAHLAIQTATQAGSLGGPGASHFERSAVNRSVAPPPRRNAQPVLVVGGT